VRHGPIMLPAFFFTDQEFRDWVAGIRTALEAVGLVRTADTGQIDTATVVKPPSTNFVSGYDIFRFNDGYQAACPIFFKLEYGSAGSSAGRPGLLLTYGQGSNGAGVLTGTVTSRVAAFPNASKTIGDTLPLYASGDGSGFALIASLEPTSSLYSLPFFIDRPRLIDGTPTTEAFVYWQAGQSGTQRWGIVPAEGTAYTNTSSTQQPLFPTHGLSRFGTEVALYPHLMCVKGRPRIGGIAHCYALADIGALVPVEADWMGTKRTLLPLGIGVAGATLVFGSAGSTFALAIPWEE
jgi:hypothetical protein